MAEGSLLTPIATRVPTALLLAMTLASLGCGSSSLEVARERGLTYFGTAVDSAGPSWSYLAPYLDRRFGIALVLADGRVLRDAQDDAEPDLALEATALPPFRRLFAPDARSSVTEIEALESPVDRTLAVALHCDRLGLPPDWKGILERATARGGYAATHAALALGWSVENGCVHWVDASALRHQQVEALVKIVEERESLAQRDERAADIWVEALALLYYAGGQSRVEPVWLDALLELQRSDGGWPEHPAATRSSPHTSVFAVWALSEALQEDAVAPTPMVPRSGASPPR